MSINLVVESGIVQSRALRYAADGKPEFRFTLIQTENGFPLYLPCCAVGRASSARSSCRPTSNVAPAAPGGWTRPSRRS
jgi:hypothetical protein